MEHRNHIILSDGKQYYLFERENKNVPFDAYSKSKSLKISDSIDGLFEDCPVPLWDIEKESPIEVIFND